jgi:hypothetical protein
MISSIQKKKSKKYLKNKIEQKYARNDKNNIIDDAVIAITEESDDLMNNINMKRN